MNKKKVELLQLQHEYFIKNNKDYNAFPEYWYEIEDKDDLKIEMLKEAISKNKLLIETKGAENFIEAVIL